MRYVLINHKTAKASASLDLEKNILRLRGKNKEIVIGRGTQLKGEVGRAWFAMTDIANFGTQPRESFGILIGLPTNDQLADWMPSFTPKAEPKGCLYLQEGEDMILHSVWKMK